MTVPAGAAARRDVEAVRINRADRCGYGAIDPGRAVAAFGAGASVVPVRADAVARADLHATWPAGSAAAATVDRRTVHAFDAAHAANNGGPAAAAARCARRRAAFACAPSSADRTVECVVTVLGDHAVRRCAAAVTWCDRAGANRDLRGRVRQAHAVAGLSAVAARGLRLDREELHLRRAVDVRSDDARGGVALQHAHVGQRAAPLGGAVISAIEADAGREQHGTAVGALVRVDVFLRGACGRDRGLHRLHRLLHRAGVGVIAQRGDEDRLGDVAVDAVAVLVGERQIRNVGVASFLATGLRHVCLRTGVVRRPAVRDARVLRRCARVEPVVERLPGGPRTSPREYTHAEQSSQS